MGGQERYFPRLAVPISITVSQLLKLGLQILFFLGFMVYFGLRGAEFSPNWAVCLLPVLILIIAVLVAVHRSSRRRHYISHASDA